MRARPTIATFLFLSALLRGPGTHGQVPPGTAPAEGTPLFSVRSELVVLDVVVKDRKNEYVAGLTREAFTIEEDGVRQTMRFFVESDAPATVGLLIDSSGSMIGAAEAVLAAVGTFAETSNPRDELFALTFNNDVRPALPANAPFTGNAQTLRQAVAGGFDPWGPTALYDAIAAGFDYLARGKHQRKALVVVSDGGDNASRATLDQVVAAAQTSNTVIHAVVLRGSGRRDGNPAILMRLTETTGGSSFRPGRPGQVETAFRDIAHDIRNSYSIGYVSTNTVLDGRLRQVRVTAEGPGHRNLQVRTRQGYVAK